MNDAAHVEAKRVGSEQTGGRILQYVPRQEANWREGVVKQVQASTGHSFTTEHATPPATQPVPNSSALNQVQAIRIGAEPTVIKDLRHRIKIGRSYLTGESVWSRVSKAFRGVDLLRRRRTQQANDTRSKTDVSQLEIE